MPPLLVKTKLFVNESALVGLKATWTTPVSPGGTLKVLLALAMKNGGTVATLPVNGWPPRLEIWKLCVLLWLTSNWPKGPFVGLTDRSGGRLVTMM